MSGAYTQIPQKYFNPTPARNAFGIISGNDVSLISGNMVDIESELKGITRSLSRCPSQKYQPVRPLGSSRVPPDSTEGPFAIGAEKGPGATVLEFVERSTQRVREIDTTPRHLPTIQMMAFPGVPKPEPLTVSAHGAPWRF